MRRSKVPKIGMLSSSTFKLGDQWEKVVLEISDIDTSLPLEPQLKEVQEAEQILWEHMVESQTARIRSIYEDYRNS